MTSNNQNNQEQKEVLESSKESSGSSENESPLRSATTEDEPSFGWSAYAERVNGRFAMVGFIAILLVEVFSNASFLHWAGLVQ